MLCTRSLWALPLPPAGWNPLVASPEALAAVGGCVRESAWCWTVTYSFLETDVEHMFPEPARNFGGCVSIRCCGPIGQNRRTTWLALFSFSWPQVPPLLRPDAKAPGELVPLLSGLSSGRAAWPCTSCVMGVQGTKGPGPQSR